MRSGQKIGLIAGPLSFFLVLAAQIPLKEDAHRLAAVIALVVVLWLTEALPLAVTALLGSVLAILLGVAPAQEVFAPYADPVIFLLLGSLLVSEGLIATGLDARLARYALGGKTIVLGERFLALAAAGTAFLSMWMSNTVAAAVVMPLVQAALSQAQLPQRFKAQAVLTVAYAASIGGIATPIGTPANLIALGFLRRAGTDLSFAVWMALVFPLLVVLLGAWLVLARQNRVRLALVPAPSPPWQSGERWVAGVFALMLLGWLAPGFSALWGEPSHSLARLAESSVALAGAVALFILPATYSPFRPILTQRALQRIDWGTLLLFGGGLSLGALASKTGLSFWLGQKLLAATGIESSLGLIALSATLALVLTEFMSNTAAVAIVLPVVSGMAGALGIPATPAVMAATLAASMAFVLPVSTPPNAIAYSTGLVTVGQMVRFGLALDALALAAICLWSWLVWVKL